ncbi:leucine-rich repeat transmembrane protein FLRT3 [Micropterus dolomieu]|uniref:leucine-rich repeat transmembrane protein FLRT3 n=1 Tax=Micropterus dolomieu TaxID=147949 RepID=UPI001E8D9E8C|nr:leucine-rich repeat transmembrane protein FLRT3 [Micropterus dolomieu]
MPWCRCGVLLVLCVCPLACLVTSPCPPGCCCSRPGFLVLCESLGLRSLPRSVPFSTSALSVARNQLCNVDHLLRPFSSLQELSLSHNLLSRFPRGLPPSLESLLLQENRITYITSGALRQLGNLTRLDLEDNRIRAIQPGALQGLNKLQVLTLKGNKLTSLPLNLPPSLTHLDLSANCISVLDLPSLSALVNLQVLKINSNCLRSVPESAFDGLPRLRSVDLNNNLWVCECDILYLYRWLLSGRLRMATDLVCTEPVHLAHRLLLDLSVVAICPWVLKPNEGMHQLDLNSALERKLETPKVKPTGPSSFENKSYLGNLLEQISQKNTVGLISKDAPKTRVLLEHYSLETLTYEECLLLNKTHSVSPPHLQTTTSVPDEGHKCRNNITGRYTQINATSAEGTRSLLSTNRDAPRPTPDPQPITQQDSAVVISLLAVLCVLVVVLILAVLLVLKKVLLRQQRVAPLNVGSGG